MTFIPLALRKVSYPSFHLDMGITSLMRGFRSTHLPFIMRSVLAQVTVLVDLSPWIVISFL